MPSPFPGMDPFIEGQKWQDFHTTYVVVMRELLLERLRPDYVVDVEQHVYIVRDSGEPVRAIGPDVTIAERFTPPGGRLREESDVAVADPVVHHYPLPDQIEQPYLKIRTKAEQDVVTIIELLSPTNKATGDGQHDYLTKRQNILMTFTNLVEIDLLRGGARLPTLETLAIGDYHAFVTRPPRVGEIDVFSWGLRHRMPTIPIPLAAGDGETTLDLQRAFDVTYDRSGYEDSLAYGRPVVPNVSPDDENWIRQIISRRG